VVERLGLGGVRRPVVYLFPLPAADQQVAGAQQTQVVGHRRRRHLHDACQLGPTGLAVAQQPKDPQAAGVAELLEQDGYRLKLLYPGNMLRRKGLRPVGALTV